MLNKARFHLTFPLFILFTCACAPALKYSSYVDSVSAKKEGRQILVLKQNDSLPNHTRVIGEVKIGDTGFSSDCGFDRVVGLAIEKARSTGGDGIQITEIKSPDFLSTCWRIVAKIIEFVSPKMPADWQVISKNESDVKAYYSSNVNALAPIEGIWTVTPSGTWRNLANSTTGTIPKTNPYRIAVIKGDDGDKYDYVGFILESGIDEWKPGAVKVRFRRTAYPKVYDGVWYNADFTDSNETFVINDVGLITVTRTEPDTLNNQIELSYKMSFVKAYPPYSSEPVTSGESVLSGTGFLLSENGLIVTNYHVVDGASKILVAFPEKNIEFQATVKIKDSKNDIAILEMKDFVYKKHFAANIPFTLNGGRSARIGESVYTLGYPLSSILGAKPRLATGQISSEYGIKEDPRVYQISAPLQPGNSGGPLLNLKGEIVGIVVSGLNAKYLYEEEGIIPQNVNFAVKSSYLQNLISMLSEEKEILARKSALTSEALDNSAARVTPFIGYISAYQN